MLDTVIPHISREINSLCLTADRVFSAADEGAQMNNERLI